MGRIVSSSGIRPRKDGAVSINPFVRALEDRYRRLGTMIEGRSSTCPHRPDGRNGQKLKRRVGGGPMALQLMPEPFGRPSP